MVRVEFENDVKRNMVRNIIYDFNTYKSSVRNLLLNTYDCVIGNNLDVYAKKSSILLSGELIVRIPNSRFQADELTERLDNLGYSTNKTYRQGNFGLGVLSYLNICDTVEILGDGKRFIIDENGYQIENLKEAYPSIIYSNRYSEYDNVTEIRLKGVDKDYSYVGDSNIRPLIEEYLSYTHYEPIKNNKFDYNGINSDFVRIRGDVKIDTRYNNNKRVENDYYLAVNRSGKIYLNNIPLCDSDGVEIYLKTDKYINKDNVITADISPVNLKVKNKEEIVRNAKRNLRSNKKYTI